MAKNRNEKAFRITVEDVDAGSTTTLTVYSGAVYADDRSMARDIQYDQRARGLRTTDVKDKRHKRRR